MLRRQKKFTYRENDRGAEERKDRHCTEMLTRQNEKHLGWSDKRTGVTGAEQQGSGHGRCMKTTNTELSY